MLTLFGLLSYLILIFFAWLICEARAVEQQRGLVEFLVFNLLALVWLELARLVLNLAYLLA